MLRALNPKELEDDDAESDSSNLSSTVASVAIEAGGSTATKKRKMSPLEEGKKDEE